MVYLSIKSGGLAPRTGKGMEMTTITERNAKALIERNGSTLPEAKTPRKVVAKGNQAVAEGKDQKAPAKAAVPIVSCGCGCGETANPGRLYKPGHDARHAGQVGRALVAKAPGAEEAAASLPTALEAKARAFAANAAKKEAAKEARAQVRADAKAALEAALAAL